MTVCMTNTHTHTHTHTNPQYNLYKDIMLKIEARSMGCFAVLIEPENND